ncbi:MAG TPA: aminoglycoside phosphotransferase, partial [Parvularcula sp.]|nr:aminoglycoside phosphotransferase [Parvularcula sp.]
QPSTLVMRDFHAENVLWLPDRAGHRRAGVIDFQDGLFGNPAYDLVSLLEDARRDVSPELAEAMIRRYAAGAGAFSDFDEEAYRRDYAILGAQRNAKILGIFARLIRRDGKPRYADFFPRVEGHFRRDLQHKDLHEVARFFRRHFPERF